MYRQLAVLLLLAGRAFGAASIEFTSVPPYGSTSNLFGRVYGVNPASNRVAVFINAPGAGWYTKPTCAQPLTTIAADGTWTADITTGANDPNATQIAAFVVPATFNDACVLGLPCLTNSFIASTLATRVDPAVRSFHWSGYDWWVKSSAGKVGPGPNYFSDSTNNVSVDAQGRLHLRITEVANKWYCAEIVSQRTLGFGRYVFKLNTLVDALDPNVTLGLFTWSDAAAFDHREIDVECARWGNAGDTNNSQFVVQPYEPPGHLVRYRTTLTNSTHAFNWRATNVVFTADNTTWTYTNAVPPSCDENVRLNLWLFSGNAPDAETEIVIEKFEFTPPDANGDGLPDAWAQAHDVTSPIADDDGDGLTNVQEYRAGTDPANPGSSLAVQTITTSTSNTVVAFRSVLDKTYTVEATGSFQPTGWSILASNVAGTGGLVQIRDENAPSSNRYYRVRVAE